MKKASEVVKNVVPKVIDGATQAVRYAAPVARTIGTALASTGVPQATAIGNALNTGANIAEAGVDFLGPLRRMNGGNGGRRR